MSFAKDALSIDDIERILSKKLRPLASEVAPLTHALDRVAGHSMCASFDLPRFDKSAMDGYAVSRCDLNGGVLTPIGESHIGMRLDLVISKGQTLYVSTGSPVPVGTAAVVPVELTRALDGAIVVGPTQEGKHVMHRGETIREGQVILEAGHRIDLATLSLLAAQGIGEISVVSRPTVAFLATGDEVADDPGEFQVLDAITPVVKAWCHRHGLALLGCRRVPDDLAAIRSALAEAGADLMITSGGASVGRKDFTRRAVAGIAEIIVPGVCVKPGSPAFVAVNGRATYLGLPGNPNAAVHQLALLGERILDRLSGIRDGQGVPSACRPL